MDRITRIIAKVTSDVMVEYKKVPMVGTLDLSQNTGSYGILTLPEEFKKSVFDAIKTDEMQYDDNPAHLSVFDTDEMDDLDLPLKEDGKQFTFEIESVDTVNPEGWDEMEQVWFVRVKSPELEDLRKKYNLEPKLHGHNFHMTVAVKPEKKKAASMVDRVAARAIYDRKHHVGKYGIYINDKFHNEFNSERQAEKEIEFLHKNGVEFDDIDVIFRQST